jgi:hypothetical protein
VDINAAVRDVIELTRSEPMKSGVVVQMQLVEGLRAVFDQTDTPPSLRAQRSNPAAGAGRMDCFVASLLAMTVQGYREPLLSWSKETGSNCNR